MNEFVDIIVIYIVFRAILAFLGAWWHGDGRNDFRRDRIVLPIIVVKPPGRPKSVEYHHLCIHLFPLSVMP